MKIHLSNSIWIGNIDPFIRSFDTSNEKVFEITSHKRWVSVHPVILCMISALGLFMRKHRAKISFEKMEATSKHYFHRMGLFELLKLDSEMKIKPHESAGRFIPIQQIKNSDELGNFIKDMIPLLHLEPEKVEPIKYGELLMLSVNTSTTGGNVSSLKEDYLEISFQDVNMESQSHKEDYLF